MNRRTMIKMAGIGGLVAGAALEHLVGSGPAAVTDAPMTAPAGYILLTARPDEDLRYLRRAIHLRQLRVAAGPVSGVGQDLTILSGGRILDPRRDGSPALARLSSELRRRKEPARYLLQVDGGTTSPDTLTIEQDGVVREVVDLQKSYRRIEVAGAVGMTVFRLENGGLSVVQASCRHEYCRRVGLHTHGRLVCAPNRLVASMPPHPSNLDVIAG